MGEHGLTAGRFYAIYSPKAAVPIEDDNLRARFESKRDADLEQIHTRMREVEMNRWMSGTKNTAKRISPKGPKLIEKLWPVRIATIAAR